MQFALHIFYNQDRGVKMNSEEKKIVDMWNNGFITKKEKNNMLENPHLLTEFEEKQKDKMDNWIADIREKQKRRMEKQRQIADVVFKVGDLVEIDRNLFKHEDAQSIGVISDVFEKAYIVVEWARPPKLANKSWSRLQTWQVNKI